MKYIIIDKSTKQVKSKHDVATPPAITVDEELLPWTDIIANKILDDEEKSFVNIPIGFAYDVTTRTFSSPPAPVVITQLQTDIAALNFSSPSEAQTKLKTILERLRYGEK